MENKQKNSAFTLIELLVVIVIIGILATVSTATFNGQKDKAVIAKYQAQRVQASKERYSECLSIRTENCGPSFALFRTGAGIVQKNTQSAGSDPASLILNINSDFAITPDGKDVFYENGGAIYRRTINHADVSFAGDLVVSSGANFYLSITPDGKYLFYNGSGGAIYKKDLSTPASNIGDIFVDVGYAPTVSPNGKDLIYVGNTYIYKKSINSSNASDPGNSLVASNSTGVSISPDGEFIIYDNSNASNRLYKKDIDSSVSDEGDQLTTTGADGFVTISSDGRNVYYGDSSYNIFKKNINTPASNNGEPFGVAGVNFIIFP